MADLFGSCNDQGTPEKDFMLAFCMRCHNKECDRAGGRNKWEQRISTQEDRFLINPRFADPLDPQYAEIHKMNFPSLFREAIRIELSDRKGDWNVVSDQEVDAVLGKGGLLVGPTGLPITTPPKPEVPEEDEAPKLPPAFAVTVETEPELFPQEREPEPSPEPVRKPNPPKQPPKQPPPRMPQQGIPMNTEIPPEGIMLDGGPTPSSGISGPPVPEVDPWAVPDGPAVKKVAVGATIRLGGSQK